jgi:hypothetical protein
MENYQKKKNPTAKSEMFIFEIGYQIEQKTIEEEILLK